MTLAVPVPHSAPGALDKIATIEDVAAASKKDGDVRTAPDAGLRSLDHYKRALPTWRYAVRQFLLPIIRWETPYLAYFQGAVRTPLLDSYFAITANLGTHTFYMVGLPLLFWCGYSSYGKALVHVLASGVFFTGFIKDMLSLPRPLSPPLHRITMTGYAALEYGFPSTHSANAVSVAAYALLLLRDPENTLSEGTKTGLEYLAYFYAFSIVIGRLYCGMHGFLDVIFGSILGLFIGVVEFYYGPELDLYMYNSSWFAPLIATLIIIALVRIHPEPADDCPCFDDSVAFAGVVIGLECGTWTYGRTAWDPFIGHAHGLQSMDVTKLSWYILLARLVIGVAIIFVWREVTKPALLKFLPHIFRVITRAGWILPRRFFKPASQYQTVSPKLRLDNVFPAVSDLPRVVESMRHPNSRGRSVSVGPQSAADAYETLAYRERRRRESIGSNGSLRSKSSLTDLKEKSGGHEEVNKVHETRQSLLKQYESMMGEGEVLVSRTGENGKVDVYAARGDGLDETEMFSRLVRPRVRYDVEVVTKLVVYAGIGWLSTSIIPVILELIGLGESHLR
ncbi:PAP2 superfamily protein [Scedosporium apiospermum]|uniref:PAP2 superfamily protein n=1 Tax=Pseudallescheria apiosperma TaxID=563466 RepID=A0A084GFH9_PSEDA|nr:PAP2 superfamily protein [Scedosporium apiospermum]KEZ46091.1 PAP2 superfamily protein [Scedosporium apiospermum]